MVTWREAGASPTRSRRERRHREHGRASRTAASIEGSGARIEGRFLSGEAPQETDGLGTTSVSPRGSHSGN